MKNNGVIDHGKGINKKGKYSLNYVMLKNEQEQKKKAHLANCSNTCQWKNGY
jgi:hypothetical protein